MTREAADAAQKNADEAWADHNDAVTHLRTALRAAFAARSAATGMNMGPQYDAAVDVAVTCAVDHAHDLILAHDAKARALNYQDERDQIATALPAPPPPAPAPQLERGTPADIRAWLQHASAAEVADALADVDSASRVKWADILLGWVRADGNTADVIALLRGEDPRTETVPDEVT